MSSPDTPSRHPLVLAATAFLLGMAAARTVDVSAGWILAAVALSLAAWVAMEWLQRQGMARIVLVLGIAAAGAAAWSLNQRHAEPMHVVRFVSGDREFAVSLRMRVLVAPGETGRAGNSSGWTSGTWVGRAQEILTDHGWLPAAGDLLVRWRSPTPDQLQPGDVVEVYGWLSRPSGVMNPGGIDRQKLLAADRIFAEVRVPRPTGVVVIDSANAAGPSWLARMRLFLRAKLLEHMVQQDVPAAYTMTALLLGTRDPAMGEVSQAFADSGVAHLLAISGSHIVFFAAMVWALLRLLPMRPRLREVIIALVVGAYVLATPCGPPIVRATVALLMVVLSRLAGRPRDYLNMLAAAALVVVLLRPADIADAGCQLSFVSTAGLILFAERMYHGLFGRWLQREALVAELADTALARRRLLLYKWACGLLVANIIGAATAAPLVAFHFGQTNLWAVAAGLIALPVVSVAMVIGALQLIAALLWNSAAAALGPISVAAGQLMIWVVGHLAKWPGAAVPLRPPPAWAVAGIYTILLLWAARRRLGLSRATIINILVAMTVATAGWYAWTQPIGRLRITILSAGDASALLMRTPSGTLWAMDTGAPRTSHVTAMLSPAMRLAGSRHLHTLLLTSLDAAHASGAGEAVHAYSPGTVLLSSADWEKRGETLAGANLAHWALANHVPVQPLHAGQIIEMGHQATAEILWPAQGDLLERRDLIVLLSYAGKKILLVDPASIRPLALVLLARPELKCDAIIFLGAQRGAGDQLLLPVIAPLQAKQIIWCGRGPWAESRETASEFNSANGAVQLEIDAHGLLRVH